jgi:hypothetical protein
VTDNCCRIDLQNGIVPHADPKGLATIKTVTVYRDLLSRKQPAHGQRLKTSLGVPLAFPSYTHSVLRRDIGEWRPGPNIIGVRAEPAAHG